MVKKFLIILFGVSLMIFNSSCAKKENISESSSSSILSEPKLKYNYMVEESEKNLISIKFPTDYEFNEPQIIFIENFIASKICEIGGENFDLTHSETPVEYSQNYSDYYINIESKTSYVSDNMISIVFAGLFNKKSAAHPMQLFFTLNFNPKTMNTIDFSSIHAIDDVLYNEFAKQGEKQILEDCGGVWPEEFGNFSETFYSKERFLTDLKDGDIYWYYTEKNVGFSYSVPYALGGHKEVELERSILRATTDNTG